MLLFDSFHSALWSTNFQSVSKFKMVLVTCNLINSKNLNVKVLCSHFGIQYLKYFIVPFLWKTLYTEATSSNYNRHKQTHNKESKKPELLQSLVPLHPAFFSTCLLQMQFQRQNQRRQSTTTFEINELPIDYFATAYKQPCSCMYQMFASRFILNVENFGVQEVVGQFYVLENLF